MFERFSRSWNLIKASAAVLAKDKELLVFPLLSAIATLIVAAAFVLPALGLGALDGLGEDGAGLSIGVYVLAFLFYLVQYFVIFFFNSALVGAAMIRLRAVIRLARRSRIATSRAPQILGYAAIAATVGMIPRAVQERAGWIGRLVAGFSAWPGPWPAFSWCRCWCRATSGPIDAVKESALLLKKTWGENLIGQGGVGLVFGLGMFALIVVGVAAIVGAAMTGSMVFTGGGGTADRAAGAGRTGAGRVDRDLLGRAVPLRQRRG